MTHENVMVSDLFSTRRVAKILSRSQFCIWYHARNVEPVWVDNRMYLTRSAIKTIVENHLRLKAGEDRAQILALVEKAKP